jgi:phospholipid/cholesterol/gamma-HCH transport system ATP-binding protein
MSDTLIHFENILLETGAVKFFRDFTLDLPAGKFIVIMGPSGSGKSLILKLAAGILVPHQGRVFFRGQDWDTMSSHETIVVRSKIGFVFQNRALWANKSLYQNLELPLTFHHPGISRHQVQEKIEQLCSLIHFTNNLNLKPAQLSLGEQKQIAFLRAYCLNPEVLFLDDAMASLDSEAKDRIVNVLANFKKQGRSALMITHDPVITAQLADYLVILKKGKILEKGDFNVVTKSKNPEVMAILSSVLNQTATYSMDILDLLSNSSL